MYNHRYISIKGSPINTFRIFREFGTIFSDPRSKEFVKSPSFLSTSLKRHGRKISIFLNTTFLQRLLKCHRWPLWLSFLSVVFPVFEIYACAVKGKPFAISSSKFISPYVTKPHVSLSRTIKFYSFWQLKKFAALFFFSASLFWISILNCCLNISQDREECLILFIYFTQNYFYSSWFLFICYGLFTLMFCQVFNYALWFFKALHGRRKNW